MDFENFYNNIEEYRAFREGESEHKEYDIWTNWKIKHLVNIIPSGYGFNNILEVGCAFGMLLNKFSTQKRIKDVYGLDIAKVNTDYGAKLFPHIKFLTGTIESSEFIKQARSKGEYFDLVILSDIVEHVPNDLDFLKEVKSISKYVVLNHPLEKSFANRNRNYGETDISGHLKAYNLKDALELIKEAGFNIINYKTEIVHHERECYLLHKNEQQQRLAKKHFFKKTFWTFIYNIEDLILFNFPALYIKLTGCNLFAFLSSIESEK